MSQLQSPKVGSRKKGRRSAHSKAYYQTFRVRYSGKLIRRRARRERQLAFFEEHPEAGSPSQVRMRRKVANRKLRVKRNEEGALDSR